MNRANKRILCIDDHYDSCELLSYVLETSGYEFDYAQTIAAGLSKMSATRFDLYIFDTLLPDGCGVNLCEKVREQNPQTPIIFCSAQAYSKTIDEAYAAGADAYLVKPVDADELIKVISRLLRGTDERMAIMRKPEGMASLLQENYYDALLGDKSLTKG
ncbi:MAG: response regulator [Acidobacteriota bacterium]